MVSMAPYGALSWHYPGIILVFIASQVHRVVETGKSRHNSLPQYPVWYPVLRIASTLSSHIFLNRG